jgi:hypothetical protein
MKKSDEGSDEVGYKKPPKATRFKKGQSGNPKGRPKGKSNMAVVIRRTLQAKVVINENGLRREVDKFEAAMMQLANKAAGGDLRALNLAAMLVRMAEERLEQDESRKSDLFEDTDKRILEGLMKRFEATSEGGNDNEADRERETN